MPEKKISVEPQAKKHSTKKPRPKTETDTNEPDVQEHQEVDASPANGEVANTAASSPASAPASDSLKNSAMDKRAVKKLAKEAKAAAAAVAAIETAEAPAEMAVVAAAAAATAAAQVPSVVRELQEETELLALLAVRSGSGGSGSGIGAATGTGSGNGSGSGTHRQPSLVMACFSANWCRPCQVFAPKLELIARRYNRVAFVKLNVEKLLDVADKYKVRAVPTFVLFKDGVQVGSVVAASQAKLELLLANNGAVPLDDTKATPT